MDQNNETYASRRRKQRVQKFFFPPKMAPAQITSHIFIVIVISSIIQPLKLVKGILH